MKSRDQMLLEEAYQRILEGVHDPHIFKAIFMAGPPGAGKSTVAQKLVGGSGLRSLNIDNFNELLVKKGQLQGGTLTDAQKYQSYERTEKQRVNWVDGRLGLLIDGSGRNINNILEYSEPLKKLGYDVACILVNVDVETAIARAKNRAIEQAKRFGTKHGRNVPEDYQRAAHSQVQSNIPILQDMFGKNFFYVDTSTEVPENFNEVQKGINRFMSAPPSHPAALEWIRQQKEQRNTLKA